MFLTKEARFNLFKEGGVRIVKDSSANKCGVITSSYEICSSMLLNHDEFMAIKEELVDDVLKKLRELAELEAEVRIHIYTCIYMYILIFFMFHSYSSESSATTQEIFHTSVNVFQVLLIRLKMLLAML